MGISICLREPRDSHDKENRRKRLCVDYRDLNKITVPDQYPTPLIEDHIKRLAGFKYFTSLDLLCGYFHIPINEDSIPFTAFITQDGHYEYLGCPFDLTNAPAVFQRMINTALGQLRFNKVLRYLDHILIPANTTRECNETLREVLKIFRDHGLTMRLSKCFFLQPKIEYLGDINDGSTIRPSPWKTTPVENFPNGLLPQIYSSLCRKVQTADWFVAKGRHVDLGKRSKRGI
jgi:hypothetical protein